MAMIGVQTGVLTSLYGVDGAYRTGRSYADSPDIDGTVYFDGDCLPGDFAAVRITGIMDGELSGEQVKEDAAK